MIKVLFICHGNICRSPMCQSIFTHMVKEQNLTNHFKIDSAATSREEMEIHRITEQPENFARSGFR